MKESPEVYKQNVTQVSQLAFTWPFVFDILMLCQLGPSWKELFFSWSPVPRDSDQSTPEYPFHMWARTHVPSHLPVGLSKEGPRSACPNHPKASYHITRTTEVPAPMPHSLLRICQLPILNPLTLPLLPLTHINYIKGSCPPFPCPSATELILEVHHVPCPLESKSTTFQQKSSPDLLIFHTK